MVSSFLRKVSTSSADYFAAGFFPHDFDLSRNQSLRTLQVTARDINRVFRFGSQGTASLLIYALSTITSPSFSEVVVRYRWDDFPGVESWRHPDRPPLRELSQDERAAEAFRHRRRFGLLREVHKVRDFQLVLDVSVWGTVGEYSVQRLKEVLAEEKARGGFDEFLSEPLVTYHPLGSRLCDLWSAEVPC